MYQKKPIQFAVHSFPELTEVEKASLHRSQVFHLFEAFVSSISDGSRGRKMPAGHMMRFDYNDLIIIRRDKNNMRLCIRRQHDGSTVVSIEGKWIEIVNGIEDFFKGEK